MDLSHDGYVRLIAWRRWCVFFFSSRRRHTRCLSDWSSDVCSSDLIRGQFHHMIDIVPTILEATGISAPATVNGIAQRPIEGVSMAYTFDKANAAAKSKRETQYFEMFGNRAIYHDGWYAATTPPAPPWLMGTTKLPEVKDYKWELYNLTEDFSQNNDLAVKNPDKLR